MMLLYAPESMQGTVSQVEQIHRAKWKEEEEEEQVKIQEMAKLQRQEKNQFSWESRELKGKLKR